MDLAAVSAVGEATSVVAADATFLVVVDWLWSSSSPLTGFGKNGRRQESW